MLNQDRRPSTVPSEPAVPASPTEEQLVIQWHRVVRRRSFLKAGLGVGIASAALPASALFPAVAQAKGHALTAGDIAILRFLAAVELIESDLWQQYNELGGVAGGNAAYKAALANLDNDMPQYITDNTDDELSHAAFLNAYLRSKGAQPVNLDALCTLPSSKATGAKQIGRLTNLQKLDVDTSFYTRYRSAENPDFGAIFSQAVTIKNQPAIPLSDTDTPPNHVPPNPPVTSEERRIQAIANSAAFHFAFIEQGGASLYTTMALKARDAEVLRIVVSIGGVEVDHFSLWHDKLAGAVSPGLNVTDPETGNRFPDLSNAGEALQPNLILPEPTDFISKQLPECSVIRPSLDQNAGAVATIRAFIDDLLFAGQSPEFFETVMALAHAADAAQRGF